MNKCFHNVQLSTIWTSVCTICNCYKWLSSQFFFLYMTITYVCWMWLLITFTAISCSSSSLVSLLIVPITSLVKMTVSVCQMLSKCFNDIVFWSVLCILCSAFSYKWSEFLGSECQMTEPDLQVQNTTQNYNCNTGAVSLIQQPSCQKSPAIWIYLAFR